MCKILNFYLRKTNWVFIAFMVVLYIHRISPANWIDPYSQMLQENTPQYPAMDEPKKTLNSTEEISAEHVSKALQNAKNNKAPGAVNIRTGLLNVWSRYISKEYYKDVR